MKARVLLHLARAMRSQWWTTAEIASYQEQAIVRIMQYSVASVPFYRGLRISPRDIRSVNDLQRFPIVTKSMVQESPAQFVADGHDRATLRHSLTSGSTGEPTTTYFDDDSWALAKYA